MKMKFLEEINPLRKKSTKELKQNVMMNFYLFTLCYFMGCFVIIFGLGNGNINIYNIIFGGILLYCSTLFDTNLLGNKLVLEMREEIKNER